MDDTIINYIKTHYVLLKDFNRVLDDVIVSRKRASLHADTCLCMCVFSITETSITLAFSYVIKSRSMISVKLSKL